MPNTKDMRDRELAAIHVAKRDLGMSDSDYRYMLMSVANTTSAKNLSDKGRTQVLDHLRTLGWKRKPRQRVAQHPGRPHNLNQQAQLQKIEAQLADMKLTWSYADAIARRQYGVEKVAWLRCTDQLSAVIAALDVEQEKRSLLAQLDQILTDLNSNREELEQQWDDWGLRKNWHRNRRILKRIVEELMPVHAEVMAQRTVKPELTEG